MAFIAIFGIYAGTILGFLLGMKEGGVEGARGISVVKVFGLATLFASAVVAAQHF